MKIKTDLLTQYPWNHQIPVIVRVVPDKDLTSLEVFGRAGTVDGIEIIPSNYKVENAHKGQDYEFKFIVKPNYPGEYRISFTAVANDKGNLSSVATESFIKLNESLVVEPVSKEYKKLEIAWFSGVLASILLVIIGLWFLYKKVVFPKIGAWFKKQVEPTF